MTPLRQRMLQDMGIRNLAANTQLAYVQQISAFARHFDCSPEALGPEQVRACQVHLIEERKLAAGSLSVVAAALRFLYKIALRRPWNDDDIPMPKRPLKLPIVLATCLRDALAGVGHRCAAHPTAAGASQPGHHVALPEDRHQQPVRHRQPPRPVARPATQDRTRPQPDAPGALLKRGRAPRRAGVGADLPSGRP